MLLIDDDDGQDDGDGDDVDDDDIGKTKGKRSVTKGCRQQLRCCWLLQGSEIAEHLGDVKVKDDCDDCDDGAAGCCKAARQQQSMC